MSTPIVEIRKLSKSFVRQGGEEVFAVDGIDLDVRKEEFTVLVGPSGCGKTTLLRCIAGLEDPDSGYIRVGDQIVFDSERRVLLPPEKRRISMVFQSYALWPHMTVYDNVKYPLTTGRWRPSKAEMRERVRQVLATVGIPELLNQYPKQLSGGQQQRVALARALILGTELILFDEPLSNVDAKVREQLRLELLAMQERLGFSAIFVTHDQTEAMILGDTIAVLGKGKISQIGVPRDIYAKPANRYVADFIGSANKAPVEARSARIKGNHVEFDSSLGTIVVERAQVELDEKADAVAIWRPEHLSISLASEAPRPINCWQGTVAARLYLGSHEEIVIDVGGVQLIVWTTDALDLDSRGQKVWVYVEPRNLRILNG